MARRKPRDLHAYLDAIKHRHLEALVLDPDEHPDTVAEAMAMLAAPSGADAMRGMKDYLGDINDGALAVLAKVIRMEPVSLPRPEPEPASLPLASVEPAPEPAPVEPPRPADWPDDFVPSKDFPQPMRPKPKVVMEDGQYVGKSQGARQWQDFANDLARLGRSRR